MIKSQVDDPLNKKVFDKIEAARKNLLDLGLRNRLLNFKIDGQRVIRVFDELPDQVYDTLIIQKKSMKFAPVKSSFAKTEQIKFSDEDSTLGQPVENIYDENALKKIHSDDYLETRLSDTSLQSRLLRIESEARTAIEEQGMNVLYLSLGFLKWFDVESSNDPRYAPLILIPVKLSRDSARNKFKLIWSEEDIFTNESLAVKLKTEFKIELPRLSNEVEDIKPLNYFSYVQKVIESEKRWEIVEDIALGFFTFAKLLMWRDLDAKIWPEDSRIDAHEIINSILLSKRTTELSPYNDEDFIDHVTNHDKISLVSDADSSQIAAILDVNDGRSITIQGPPGTGKSQTITNIIASALSDGKKVLFMAEKMAALEVVKRRLDKAGLGDACLELHSFKARKSEVLEKIRNTLEAAKPRRPDRQNESERLKKLQDALNEYAFAMNTPLEGGSITPHKAIGIIQKHLRITPQLENIKIPGAIKWTISKFEDNREEARLLAKTVVTIGNPSIHPWRGVNVPVLLPSDQNTMKTLTHDMLLGVEDLFEALHNVSEDLGHSNAKTLSSSNMLSKLCGLLALRPNVDIEGIIDPVWFEKFDLINSLVKTGSEHDTIVHSLQSVIKDDVLLRDFKEELNIFQLRGKSPLRLFYGEYRRVQKSLKNACYKEKRPKEYDNKVKLLEDLCKHYELRSFISTSGDLGKMAFAQDWHGIKSNWQVLQGVVDWMSGVIDLLKEAQLSPEILKRWKDISRDKLIKNKLLLEDKENIARTSINKWSILFKYDEIEAYGTPFKDVELDRIIYRLNQAQERIPGVYEWIDYRRKREIFKERGMELLANAVDSGRLTADRLIPQLEHSFGNEIIRQAFDEKQVLREFAGETHDHLIRQFCDMDKRLIDVTRQYIAAQLWSNMLHPTTGDPNSSSMNYLTTQLSKKRNLPTVRELILKTGAILNNIKPCFMMSPMSIAQYLPPGIISFDLLVIDEASQIKPEDALGAIARCNQCVIVGDSKQLPPTQFFDKLMGGDDDVDDDLSDVESILDAATYPLGGGKILRWHYRSQHESLIAFSNKEFYNSKLNVFPSPRQKCADLGVTTQYISDGIYARGGSRKNMVEAGEVAKAIIDHAKHNGDLSLGAVALSKAQQEAIQDKLEELRRANPEHEWFFSSDKDDPFFIKNLETVQGDERDVIFISIGYGKDSQGFPHMNFGPINREGGWRRLNVLITRAKQRCKVFHSIKSDEIRVDDIGESNRQLSKGRIALRNYLAYAETGQLEQPHEKHSAEADSFFEEIVADELERLGYAVNKQVGVAGFRIDLAVVDSKNPGRYILGIECDGATYHRARSARDRDRLRQEVLEGLGWIIHRIWSLDWFKDFEKELRRVILAIEEARNKSPELKRTTDHTSTIVRTAEVKEFKHVHDLVSSVPYLKAELSAPCEWQPNHPPFIELEIVIEEITKIESPIHIDELIQRIAEVWEFGRVGNRIKNAIVQTVKVAIKKRKIILKKGCCGDFLWRPDMDVPLIRDRSEKGISINMIAPEEIKRTAEEMLKVNHDLKNDNLVVEVSKCLGYKKLTTKVHEHIQKALQSA